jgi:LacI family transcriptional regulator
MLLERRVEGVIFATLAHQSIEVPAAAREVPTVLVHCFSREPFPTVLPDEEAGGHTATTALLEAGRRRIALVNLDSSLPAAALREAGYRRALRESGLSTDEKLIVTGDATAASGYEQVRALLRLPARPDGIFCANDRMAMGAYDAIREADLRIPTDVSMVGFDNQELISAYLHPGLTSVALPFDQMGAAAVAMVTDLAGGGHASSLTVPCPLVSRGSVRDADDTKSFR